MDEFAFELSQLDEVILLPIYPAREEPIAGITSEALLAKISITCKKVMSPDEAVQYLKSNDPKTERSNDPMVLLTIGAGDIDRIVPQLKTEFVL